LAFTQAAYKIGMAVLHRLHLSVVAGPLQKFHGAVAKFRGEPRFLFRVIAVSAVFKLVAFVCIYVGARAIHLDISIWAVMSVMPVIYVCESVPISMSGIGVRESAFIFFFSRAGLTPAEALGLSMTILAGRLLTDAFGATLLITGRKSIPLPGGLPIQGEERNAPTLVKATRQLAGSGVK
jgi:uncharacterized membrane protein YbhN (UPF0104 family)